MKSLMTITNIIGVIISILSLLLSFMPILLARLIKKENVKALDTNRDVSATLDTMDVSPVNLDALNDITLHADTFNSMSSSHNHYSQSYGKNVLTIDGNRFVILDEGTTLFGRDSASDVFINDSTVSRRHFKIVTRFGKVYITDLCSSNGTYVNGNLIKNALLLSSGDQIQAGNTIMRFEKLN